MTATAQPQPDDAAYRKVAERPTLAAFIDAARPYRNDEAALMAIADLLPDVGKDYFAWQKYHVLQQFLDEEPDAKMSVSTFVDYQMRKLNRQLEASGVAGGKLRADFDPAARKAFEERLFPQGAAAPERTAPFFSKAVRNAVSKTVIQNIGQVNEFVAENPDARLEIAEWGAGDVVGIRLYSPAARKSDVNQQAFKGLDLSSLLKHDDLMAPPKASFAKKPVKAF